MPSDLHTRTADDDFYCWKYRIWYNRRACIHRHYWQTTSACADCPQGASHLRLLETPPKRARWCEILTAAEIASTAPEWP